MKTQTIAGHTITLEEGARYIASRPLADRRREVYPVTIKPMTGMWEELGPGAVVIDGLDYDEASDLLDAFNNGVSSFDGRVW